MKTFSANEILDRFKTAVSIETDSELATYLGVKKATISNWRNRNSVDLPLLFSFCEQTNIDWLVTGRGESSLALPHYDPHPPLEDPAFEKLINKISEQGKEIGRLQERVRQLESEKNEPISSPHLSPRVMATSTPDL